MRSGPAIHPLTKLDNLSIKSPMHHLFWFFYDWPIQLYSKGANIPWMQLIQERRLITLLSRAGNVLYRKARQMINLQKTQIT
jgi:hypothetical protein